MHLGDGDDRYIARAPLAVSAARIDAGGGDDILDATGAISGGGGDDTLAGSDGGSTLSGGPGADRLDGRAGDDVLAGGEGDDRLVGGDGDDRLSGGGGDDEMDGGRGSNRLHGGAGHDGLTVWRPGRGSMPRNVLRCGGGSDSLFAPGIERLRLDPACERAAFDLVAIDGYDLTGKRLTLELRFPDRFGIRCRIRVATAAGEVAPVFRSRAAARIVEVPAPPGRVRLRLEARRPCIDFADGEGLTLILPRLRTR